MKPLLLLLFLSVAAKAMPFLVCDPYVPQSDPSLNPVSFILKGLAQNPISVPVFQQTDGSLIIHYDLAQISNGSFTVTAAAVNIFGGVSPDSVPFTFSKNLPATPTNLRISPQ